MRYDGGVRALTQTLGDLRRFCSTVTDAIPVDQALPPLLAMLRAASVPFKIIGGVAVVHHGYQRSTIDIDVVIDVSAVGRLDAALADHQFERESPSRLRHVPTGVRIDVLVSGVALARRPDISFPRPDDMAASENDPEIVGLLPLIRLKLLAARRRDEADIVELLKLLDEMAYLHLEAAIDPKLRLTLAGLRDEAMEELRFSQG